MYINTTKKVLIIIDGIKAHFRSDLDIVSFSLNLERDANSKGKSGVSIFVDMALIIILASQMTL